METLANRDSICCSFPAFTAAACLTCAAAAPAAMLPEPPVAPALIGQADYVVEDLRFDTKFAPRWGYKAVIRNQGDGTSRPSVVRWFVDGEPVRESLIGGIEAGARMEVMIEFLPGNRLTVVCDADYAISESDETNNSRTWDLPRPDLVVADLWTEPAEPLDGDQVTFFARIDNQGVGGTTLPYTVNFTIDRGTPWEEALEGARVKDEVLPGQRTLAFPNAGFEQGNLEGWMPGSRLVVVAPRYATGNRFVARLDGNDGFLRSQPFVLPGDVENLQFSAYEQYAGGGQRRFEVKRAADDASLAVTSYAGPARWRNYQVDVKEHAGETVYVEFSCWRNGQGSYWWVDDLRAGRAPGQAVVVAAARGSYWQARPGGFQITAEVDALGEIAESDETNQELTEVVSFKQADYVVEDIRFDTKFAPRWGYKAVIRNQGDGTSRPSVVRWFMDGEPVRESVLAGIEGGGKAEAMIEFVPGDELRVVCDADNALIESEEANNERTETLPRPDLVLGDIWTVPAQPSDGDLVTIYARIDNRGPGGSTQDYNVSFFLDLATTEEVDLGVVRVGDDVLPGQRTPAFPNAGFEDGDLGGWSLERRGVIVAPRYGTGNQFAARLDGNDGYLRSEPFALPADVENIQFSAHEQYAGGGLRAFSVKRAADDVQLAGSGYKSPYPWRGYQVDVKEHAGETVYVEFTSWGNGQNSYWWVDDLRLGSDPAQSVVVAAPSRIWQASPGFHTVTVEVDRHNEIAEIVEDDPFTLALDGRAIVQPEATAGGTVTPDAFFLVERGRSATFTAAPDPGFRVAAWRVDGVSAQPGGSEFVLAKVDFSTRVTAVFEPDDGVNRPPTLGEIPDQTIDESAPFSLELPAFDPDVAPQRLSFDLGDNAPEGMSLDRDTGVLTWTPDESQGPSSHAITIVVSDNGEPRLTDARSFTLSVRETNTPPRPVEIAEPTVEPGRTLTLQLDADDSDLPANRLTWALVSGPAGFQISDTGLVTWQPAPTAEPGTYPVTVRVDDDGTPPMNAELAFDLRVEAPAPIRLSVERSSTAEPRLRVTWPARPGDAYELLRALDPASPDWASWRQVTASEATVVIEITSDGTAAFFRVRRLGPAVRTDQATPRSKAKAGALARP